MQLIIKALGMNKCNVLWCLSTLSARPCFQTTTNHGNKWYNSILYYYIY